MLKKLLFTLSLPCLLVPFPTGAAESSPEREAKQFYRNFDLRDHEKPAPLQPPFTLGPAEVAAAFEPKEEKKPGGFTQIGASGGGDRVPPEDPVRRAMGL